MQADERLQGYFGLTLPRWGVYLLGVAAILAGLSIPVALRYSGWLQGEVPPSAVRPSREVRPVMVRLPGGTFLMGSPETEEGRVGSEMQHWVQISPFEMCQSEVTQENWRAVMDRNPSNCDYGCGDDHPVQSISWFDAVRYLNALTELENRSRRVRGQPAMSVCYQIDGEDVTWERDCTGYRLPTEAEWEYAARARSSTAYAFGDDSAQLGDYGWYDENSGDKAHAVGRADNPASKESNAWHLYDMHGNVWEWVWDWYGTYEASGREKPLIDPRGPGKAQAWFGNTWALDADGNAKEVKGNARVLRGGGFFYRARVLRSAVRVGGRPADRSRNVGFRCARDVPPARSREIAK